MTMTKKDNKLKAFIRNHKVELEIVGTAVLALACAGGLGYVCGRSSAYAEIRKKFEGIDIEAAIDGLDELGETLGAGTRANIISTPPADTACTAAEYFGDALERVAEFGVQADDTIANVIINVAKKAET